MAKTLKNLLIQFRFLFVAALVMLLLQAPWQTEAYTVSSGILSTVHSQVQIESSTASVGDMVSVKVALKDASGNGVMGHEVQILSNQNFVSIYSANAVSNSKGEANFMVLGEQEGIAELIAYDLSARMMLQERVKIAFVDSGQNSYYNPIFLSEEAGPLDAFRIEGLEGGVLVGDTMDVTVTAIDESGNTVTDYTGTIRFSSSDGNASFPDDYTYTSSDSGKHVFSLGVKFLTSGTQSLTVTDVDQYTISSSASFDVSMSGSTSSTSGSSSNTSSNNEGDFTLISPVSGSTSSNDIVIQGQADYGYSAIVYVNDEEAARASVEFDSESFNTTINNLDDGTYEIYVEIAELGDGPEGEEEILSVIERSEVETVTIDTTAPELIEISSDPKNPEAGSLAQITVLTEESLEEGYVLFEDELYNLDSTTTSGKYETSVPMPTEVGEYSIDLILLDDLGNEVEYRDALALEVSSGGDSTTSTTEDTGTETPLKDSESTGPFLGHSTSSGGIQAITALTARSDEERIILSWEAPLTDQPIAYYRVYYGPAPEAMFAISDTLDSTTSWVISDLEGDQIYYFSVSAVDIEGNEGAQSDSVLAVPLARTSPEGETTIGSPDQRPDGERPPALAQANSMPSKTPDTGPESTAMIILSLLGGGVYLWNRKNRVKA